jgi:S1-C subfamily serine protease
MRSGYAESSWLVYGRLADGGARWQRARAGSAPGAPFRAARPIADELASDGRVAHPFLGITYTQVTPALAAQFDLPAKQGVVISQVIRGAPAARAGIQPKDVITAVDGQPIIDETTLGQALKRRKPGERIQLTVARGSERLTIDVTLGERPGQ